MCDNTPWSASGPDALLLKIRLTPKASKDEIIGVETLSDGNQVLKVKVRSVPENGAANTALVKLLAKKLEIPRSHIDLIKGSTSRLKTLRLQADELPQLQKRLESL